MWTGERLDHQILSSLAEDEEWHNSADISKFDNSAPAYFIVEAFDVLKQNIDFDNWRGSPVPQKHKNKWANVWNHLVYYFINTPIWMPDGRVFRKSHGVPSGSWFTSMIVSVINHMYLRFLSHYMGIVIFGLKVTGDDSKFSTMQEFPFGRARDILWRELRVTLNDKKSLSTRDARKLQVMGFQYDVMGRVRSLKEWFLLALYPDTHVSNVDQAFSRWLGIHLAGASRHRGWCDFFHFAQTCWQCPIKIDVNTRMWRNIVHGARISVSSTDTHSFSRLANEIAVRF